MRSIERLVLCLVIAGCGSSKKSEEKKAEDKAAPPGAETAEAAAKAFAAAVHAHDTPGIKAVFAKPEALAQVFDCAADSGVVVRAKRALQHMDDDPHAMDGVQIDVTVTMKETQTLAKDQGWAECKVKQPVQVQLVRLDEHVVENGKPDDSHDDFSAIQLGGRWFLITDTGT